MSNDQTTAADRGSECNDPLGPLLTAWAEAAGVHFVSRSHGQCTTGTVSRDDLRQLMCAARADQTKQIEDLRAALQWYADCKHFEKCDPNAWDTVSGEPQNWWCDEAGTAMVEDGSLAGMVLSGKLNGEQLQALDDGEEA